jgi:hypothetical protein
MVIILFLLMIWYMYQSASSACMSGLGILQICVPCDLPAFSLFISLDDSAWTHVRAYHGWSS